MKIDARKMGRISVLDLSGTLTSENSQLLADKCKSLVDAGERLFVFNMPDVSWIDSTGLGEIVACYKRIRQHDGTLKLVMRGKAQDLISLVYLHRILPVFEKLDEALASFA